MRNRFLFKGMVRSLLRDTTAGVTTLATLALPVVVGSAGLVFDLNRGYQARMIAQRTADLAALGAAMAYKTGNNVQILTPTARDITLANGISGATVNAVLVDNYPASGKKSVKVTIDQELNYYLASVLGFSGTFGVSVEAYAGLSGGVNVAAPCYLALSSGASALRVEGGATITAPNCTVAAVGGVQQMGTRIEAADVISGTGNITVDWGSLIVNSIRYAGSFSAPVWNGNVPPADKRINQPTTLTDPWANHTERVAAVGQLGYSEPIPNLTNPTTPNGPTWNFNYNPNAQVSAYRQGTSNNYVVPAGNYTIGRLEVAGGINVTFQNGSNITVANGVLVGGGSTVNFGNANLYVNGGFNSGSSGVTIGNGDLWIGSGTVSFQGTNTKGDGNVVINSTISMGGGQSMTMGVGDHRFRRVSLAGGGRMKLGAGAFQANEGVFIDGDSELALLGDGNILIGPHTDGNAIKMNGSARFFMGNGTFSANGHIDTQGGSRLAFGTTTNHYINGNMLIRGAVLFGRGRYTINGRFENGTGGTVWPYTSGWAGRTYGNALQGESVTGFDMAGMDVTFILNGGLNLGGGAKTKLFAPTSATATPGGGIAELLLTSPTNQPTNWVAGSSFLLAGVVHLPNSAVTMSGGNTTLSGSRCFSLIALTILVSGGSQTGTACTIMNDSVDGLVG